MNNINYQKELEKELAIISRLDKRPRLLLHSCCAPCSSYCLVYLRQWFDITCLYYNPNITDKNEYDLRVAELHRLVDSLNSEPVAIGRDDYGNAVLIEKSISDMKTAFGSLNVIDGVYEPEKFFDAVRLFNLAGEPEGGKRCEVCFDMRLKETARIAIESGYDYFCTSLTISPLKNASVLNNIGINIANGSDGQIKWLPSDFKKRNGYKLSVELCARYDMYRQNYCGCVYSMVNR